MKSGTGILHHKTVNGATKTLFSVWGKTGLSHVAVSVMPVVGNGYNFLTGNINVAVGFS